MIFRRVRRPAYLHILKIRNLPVCVSLEAPDRTSFVKNGSRLPDFGPVSIRNCRRTYLESVSGIDGKSQGPHNTCGYVLIQERLKAVSRFNESFEPILI